MHTKSYAHNFMHRNNRYRSMHTKSYIEFHVFTYYMQITTHKTIYTIQCIEIIETDIYTHKIICT